MQYFDPIFHTFNANGEIVKVNCKKTVDVPPHTFKLPRTILHVLDISPADKYLRNAG